MLRELRVENLLLIERADLRLSAGLNVLTGETGAGKTVLAQALDLLLGGRPRGGIVRPGAEEAYVEGVFDLTAELRGELGDRLGADVEDLVLARRVGADGRTRAYIGGRSATVGDLRDLGGRLLSFYGQHEHRRLTLAAAQLEVLDGFCGERQERRLRDCATAFARVRSLHERLEELGAISAGREREMDLLDYELGEIDALAPDEHEHGELLAARERLRRLDALLAAAGGAAEELTGEAGEEPGAARLLAGAASRVAAIAGVDPALDRLGERLRSLLIECEDLGRELRDYGDSAGGAGLDGGGRAAAGLEELEQRLSALERLARKHGGSIAGVLEFAEEARARRAELSGAETAIGELGGELELRAGELEKAVAALRRARRAAAEPFARGVRAGLADLAMGEASFAIEIDEREAGPHGGDAVEFIIAPNPGVPAAPLREIASGGELSRVMLAIMGAASGSGTATLVFDEVDAGVGGQTARAVGARLRALAGRGQVLCITHLPQVASLADRHFSIVKDTTAETTRTTVVELEEAEVVGELVRMLGADSDDGAARRHARELRRAA